ncbi:MAG: hypothetical protein Q7S52_04145, partial [bacterium]|nr:hypothetical protein [bacterium]
MLIDRSKKICNNAFTVTVITIPKKFAEKGDLILIPKKEYEALLLQQKNIKEFSPSAAQKRALLKAEANFKRGKSLSYNDLASKLGFAN